MADSKEITRLTEAMHEGGGSRAENFFLAHGLEAAYNSVGSGHGIVKHVNAALGRARQLGRLDEIVTAGLREYGLTVTPAEEDATKTMESTVTTTDSMKRVFISHASVDKELADALADLLRLGSGLSHTQILCSSLDGMGIPIGTANYLEFLRTQISNARLVLPLLTPAFFESEVCLIEIGAMWGLEMPTFPLLVPPIEFTRVERLLGKIQGAKITDSSHLSQLHDKLVRSFGLEAETPMWDRSKEKSSKIFPTFCRG